MFKKILIGDRLAIILALVVLANILAALFFASRVNTTLDKKIADAAEANRPADIKLTLIKDSSCQECFAVDSISEGIKKYNLNILSQQSLEYTSQAAQDLIDKYNIKKVPTFIVEGELSKDDGFYQALRQIGTVYDNTFVADKLNPPYISLDSGDLVGKVDLIMLNDRTCQNCYDVTSHQKVLAGLGMYLANTETVDINSSRGRGLVNKYGIKLLPTIILSGDTSAYANLSSIWPSVGSVEDDGALVFRQGVKNMGVYKDLSTNKIIDPKAQDNK